MLRHHTLNVIDNNRNQLMANSKCALMAIYVLLLFACNRNKGETGSASASQPDSILTNATEKGGLLHQEPEQAIDDTVKTVWDMVDDKVRWFESNATVNQNEDSINLEFAEFYNQFVKDSLFQMVHINFPVIAVVGYCESTELLDQSNWKLIKDHYSDSFGDPRYSHDIVSTENLFYMGSILDDVGTVSQIGFERINGEWFLTLFAVNAC